METSRYLDPMHERFLAVLGPAAVWKKKFQADPDNGAVAGLLEQFSSFILNYFQYLAQHTPPETLERDLKSAFSTLHREWVTISRVCEQRQVDEFGPALKGTDLTAKEYYDRFLGYKSPNVTPITYFAKLYAITRSNFTNYPLTSMPLYVLNDSSQWTLGLAHEIGHHIYWNSARLLQYQTVQGGLRTAVLRSLEISTMNYDDFSRGSKLASIWVNWLEEVFADVAGTLLAGREFAISALTVMSENAPGAEALTADDGEHPSPYLRPLLALEALNWVSEQLEDGSNYKSKLQGEVDRLRAQWEHQVEGRLQVARMSIHETSGLKMSDIEGSVRSVVRVILGEDSKNAGAFKSWVNRDGQPEDLGRLIDCRGWLPELDNLPMADAARQQRDVTQKGAFDRARSVLPPDLFGKPIPESPLFKELVDYLKTTLDSDEEVRQALLAMDPQTQGQYSQLLEVVYVGPRKGNYVPA
jgi:hypothetical protein